jgi:hypothetical protein
VVRALQRFPQPHSGKPPHKLLSGNLRPQAAFHGFLGGSARAGAPSGACTPSPSPPTATAQFSTFLGFQPCDPCPQLPPSHMRGCFPHLLAHFCARRAENREPHAPPTPPLCAMSSVIRCEKCSPGAALHGTPPLLPPAACMMWCFVREMGEKLGRRLLSGWVKGSSPLAGPKPRRP